MTCPPKARSTSERLGYQRPRWQNHQLSRGLSSLTLSRWVRLTDSRVHLSLFFWHPSTAVCIQRQPR